MVENFFSLIKKKNKYPNMFDVVNNTSEIIEIMKIILNDKKSFSFSKNKISQYYNLSDLNYDFYEFLNEDCYNNLLDQKSSKLNYDQKIFLEKNSPEKGYLSQRIISTKSKIKLFIPCHF
jgi:hypothetical protein